MQSLYPVLITFFILSKTVISQSDDSLSLGPINYANVDVTENRRFVDTNYRRTSEFSRQYVEHNDSFSKNSLQSTNNLLTDDKYNEDVLHICKEGIKAFYNRSQRPFTIEPNFRFPILDEYLETSLDLPVPFEPPIANFLIQPKVLGFIYDVNKQYYHVDEKLTWEQANRYCIHNINGNLATIEDTKQLEFLKAVVKDIDAPSVWINGKRDQEGWVNVFPHHETRRFNKRIRHLIDTAFSLCADDATTLAIMNFSPDKITLVKTNDAVDMHSFMCEVKLPPNSKPSSEWTQIASVLYKVIQGSFSLHEAEKACFDRNPKSSLFKYSRHTRIMPDAVRKIKDFFMRYNIHEAWTGNSIIDPTFNNKTVAVLENGQLALRDTMPHYRTNAFCEMQKPKGQPKNTPYKCGNFNYSFSTKKADWHFAKNACNKQRGILAEPKTLEEMNCIIKAVTYLLPMHSFWLGSKTPFYNNTVFMYDSDDSLVSVDQCTTKDVMYSSMYSRASSNKCLSLSANSNHLKIYGEKCQSKQHYICQI